MVTCKITGCIHKVKRGMTASNHIGQSWYDYGICSCCGQELFSQKDYGNSVMCRRKLIEEALEMTNSALITTEPSPVIANSTNHP